jgi:Putative endonuclease, protein of unknown function (DUF1780)
MNHVIDQTRKGYLPISTIKVLFIAEAPPADPKRFFYFEDVATHDSLFLSMMRGLYPETLELSAAELRRRKPELLRRFQQDGYYLLDARDKPMPKGATTATKHRLLRESVTSLVAVARSLLGPESRVVLISSTVYAVCLEPLRAASLNIVNTEMIDFPGSGHQRVFRQKLGRILDERLQSAIRALEKSVQFFSAGKAQQKQRDRWVVEHFLRALGIKFDALEIKQPDDDPPDATFRGAAFEVKEIQDSGRRRGDEFKQKLEKARKAESYSELLEYFSPGDISIADVYQRIISECKDLTLGKYRVAAVRRSLDLLFYVNLGMQVAFEMEDGQRPRLDPLIADGWRSVSFLHGAAKSCVMCASSAAPDFLQTLQGRLMQRNSNDVG